MRKKNFRTDRAIRIGVDFGTTRTIVALAGRGEMREATPHLQAFIETARDQDPDYLAVVEDFPERGRRRELYEKWARRAEQALQRL